MKAVWLLCAVCSIAVARTAAAQATTYSNEADFLAAAGLAYDTFQEGFEDDGAWGPTRFPNAAYSVSSKGIVWTANLSTNTLSTSNGVARTGSWGVFSNPHGVTVGNPLDLQRDGFVGTSSTTIYGVGGWFTSNTSGAQIQFALDGKPVNFQNNQVTGQHQFFGAIDPDGFTTFEVYETEGKVEDQKLIFADDFVFCALAGSVPDSGVADAFLPPDGAVPLSDTLPGPDVQPGVDQLVVDAGADAAVARDAGADAKHYADAFDQLDATAADLSGNDTGPATDHATDEMPGGVPDAGVSGAADGCSCDIRSENSGSFWPWWLLVLTAGALTRIARKRQRMFRG